MNRNQKIRNIVTEILSKSYERLDEEFGEKLTMKDQIYFCKEFIERLEDEKEYFEEFEEETYWDAVFETEEEAIDYVNEALNDY